MHLKKKTSITKFISDFLQIFSLLRLVLGLGSFIIVQLDAWRPMSYYSYDDYMTHRLRKDVYYFSRLCMFPVSVKILHAMISLMANILLFVTVMKVSKSPVTSNTVV